MLLRPPETMAPEAVRESGVSRLSDVYSLAVVGYFLLTGKMVFEGASGLQIALQHINAAPVPPSELSAPWPWASLLPRIWSSPWLR